MYKSTRPQNHPLVNQFFGKLVLRHQAFIKHKFLPKTGIE